MLHQLALFGTAFLAVLGGALLIFFNFFPYTPTIRDEEGAKEAMEEYAKRQRKRLNVNQDETANRKNPRVERAPVTPLMIFFRAMWRSMWFWNRAPGDRGFRDD